MSNKTIPPVRGTSSQEGNVSTGKENFPPVEGWQAKPDGVVPRLRFPEFRDAGGWKETTLGEIGDVLMCKRIFANETNDSSEVPFYKIGTLGGKPDAFISKILFDEYKFKYNFPRTGEILITCSGTVGKCLPYDGKDAYYQDSNIVWIDNPTLEVSNEFLLSLLLNINWGSLNSTTITRIYGSDLRSLSLTFPTDSQEQQKIANCLSSIDELITFEAQKLDTLKAHKKGLMQHLFPAEGETLPKLRFPEFREVGEWEEKRLHDITSSVFDGTHQTPTYTLQGIPFYSVENLISGNKNKFISHDDYLAATSKNKPSHGDILLTRIGKIGYSQVVTWTHEFSVYVTLAVIKKSALFDSYYLHCFMQSERYQNEILKKSLLNAVPCKINMDSLRSTNVLLPKPAEQQKIADCLASFDDLITSQTQRLATLKTHKKGLMQQLFPVLDEVPA